MAMRRWLILLVFLAATTTLASPQQTVSVVLNGTGGRQPRLAVPDFTLAAPDADLTTAAATVAEVLWKDLEFEEEFYVIPPDEVRKVPSAASAEALPTAQWAALGADYVLLASAKRTGADLTLDLHVIGVSGDRLRKDEFPRQFGCQMSDLRTCAHTIANRLHKELRNVDGVAMTRLAFVSDRGGAHVPGGIDRGGKEVYIADYDGANPQPVTANHALNMMPTWSPDGRLLAWVSYAAGNQDIYVKSIYEVRQWRPAGGTAAIANLSPAFSPDGTQIAFVSGRDGTYQIYVVDTDGKTPPRRLTAGRAYEGVPTWSQNGAQIAFTSDRLDPTTPRLFVMNADGTSPAVVPDTLRADRPSWSPLGDKIAFTCGATAPYNICAFDTHTNQVQPLRAPDGFSSEQPVFSANGRHIAFKTNRWGKDQIAIMDLKGNIQRQITNAGTNTFPAWSRSKG
jgi:TolB protein